MKNLKILSAILAVVMILSCLPIAASDHIIIDMVGESYPLYSGLDVEDWEGVVNVNMGSGPVIRPSAPSAPVKPSEPSEPDEPDDPIIPDPPAEPDPIDGALRVTYKKGYPFSGAALATDIALANYTNYKVAFDIYSANGKEDFRVYVLGAGMDNVDITGGGKNITDGTRVDDTDWYRFEFNFTSKATGKFTLKIQGGSSVDIINPALASEYDFYIDNVTFTNTSSNTELFHHEFIEETHEWTAYGNAESDFAPDLSEAACGNGYLAVTDRFDFWAGAEVKTDIKFIPGCDYKLSFDINCVGENEDFRLSVMGAHAGKSSQELTMGGTLIGETGEWNHHEFTFTATDSGSFGMSIFGGYLSLGTVEGTHRSESDFFIDNVVLTNETASNQVIYSETFDDDAEGWYSLHSGAQPTTYCSINWETDKVINTHSNRYLSLIGRTSITQGLTLTTEAPIVAGNQYKIVLDLRCRGNNEDFRLWVNGAGRPTTNAGDFTSGGKLFGVANKWNTHEFTFTASASGNFGLKIHGGYMTSATSKSDFYVDNVYLYNVTEGTIVYAESFNDGCEGWAKTHDASEMEWAVDSYSFNYKTVGSRPVERVTFAGVTDPYPSGNKLIDGTFDNFSCIQNWSLYNMPQDLLHVTHEKGAFLQMSNNHGSAVPYEITSVGDIGAGSYKFTGYFRMCFEGELTQIRMAFVESNGTTHTYYIHPSTDEWLKVEFYVTLSSALKKITFAGGPMPEYIRPFCIDNFSIVSETAPAGYVLPDSFGYPVSRLLCFDSADQSKAEFTKFNAATEPDYEVGGFIINQDIDFLAYSGWDSTRQELIDYALGFKDSHVTEYMINIWGQVAVYPSAVSQDAIDNYNDAVKAGKTPTGLADAAYQHFVENGLDYIDIWCDTFPTIGIDPYLSFRMNDAHPGTQGSYDLYHKHPETRRVKHGSKVNAYYNDLLDYSHDVVRDFMLKVINEALSKYNCYGIELDWQRDIWLWYNGGEYNGLEIMNDFMRKVNKLVETYEAKYGHDIGVAVRTHTGLQETYEYGLDVLTWAKEGLIDIVIPTARWRPTNFDINARMWASLLHPHGVEVAPGVLECINTKEGADITYMGLETMAGAAANWFSQGADKIASFNYFMNMDKPITEGDKYNSVYDCVDFNSPVGYWNIISTVGSYEKVMKVDRRMIMTYDDIMPNWKLDKKAILPQTINAGQTMTLRIPVGDVPAGSTVTLKFGVNDNNVTTPPTTYINGTLGNLTSIEDCQDYYTYNKLLCYTVPEKNHNDGYFVVEIIPTYKLTVDHLEVFVDVPN